MIEVIVALASILVTFFVPGYFLSLALFKKLDDSDRLLSSFALSASIIIASMSFFASIGTFEPAKISAVLIIVSAASALFYYKKTRKLPPVPRLPKIQPSLPLAAITIFVLLGFYHALLFPETSWDALAYHLPFSQTFYEQSRVPTEGNLFYNLPNGMHFVNAWLYQINGFNDAFARLAPPLFGVFMILLAYLLGKRLFNPRVGAYAALFLAITPLFVAHSQIAYINLPETFFITTSFLFLYYYFSQKQNAFLLASAIFASTAILVKHTALFTIPVFLALFAYWHRKSLRSLAKPFLLFLIIAGALAAPWFLRTWSMHGNPFYPYGLLFFDGPLSSSSTSAIGQAAGWLLFDPKITYSFGNGPVLLSFGLIGLLSLKKRKQDALLLGYFALTALFIIAFVQVDGRFFFPLFVPTAIFGAVGFARLAQSTSLVRRIALLVLMAEIMFGLAFATLGFKMQESYGTQTRIVIPFPMSYEDAMQKRFGELWNAWSFIRENTSKEDKILVVAYPRPYYLQRDVYTFGSEEIIMYGKDRTILSSDLSDNISEAVGFLKSRGIKYVLDEQRKYYETDVRFENTITQNLNNSQYFRLSFNASWVKVYEVK